MRLSKPPTAQRLEVPASGLVQLSRREPTKELGAPMDINRVAQLIGCSCWTVRQALVPRGLPFFRFAPHGRMTFYREQVIAWIQSEQARSRRAFAGPTII